MQIYAYRIKAKAPRNASDSEHAKIMFDILAKKKVPISRASDAVQRALNAAANARYGAPRLKSLQESRKHGADLLDLLIFKLSALANTISNLPPNSKSLLNKRMDETTTSGVFDTEVFIELIKCLASCLPELSPRKRADEAKFLLLEGASPEGESPIVRLWEAMPSKTRSGAEHELTSKLPMSGVALLYLVPVLLNRHRPKVRLGAPPSPTFEFIRETDRIWRSLGLTSGRQYDAAGGTGHKSSLFQRFGNAALAAVGNEARISGRQIDNLKRIAASKMINPR